MVGRRLQTLAETVEQIETSGAEVLAIQAVVGDEQAVSDAFDRCRSEWRGLDILVSNAGVELAEDAAVHELELSAWERTIRTHLTGTFLVCKHGVRLLMESGRGSIVVVGSPCGLYGNELDFHAYSASKGGVHGLARVMANEYAQQGIRVNVVVPGLVCTLSTTPSSSALLAVRGVIRLVAAGVGGGSRDRLVVSTSCNGRPST